MPIVGKSEHCAPTHSQRWKDMARDAHSHPQYTLREHTLQLHTYEYCYIQAVPKIIHICVLYKFNLNIASNSHN